MGPAHRKRWGFNPGDLVVFPASHIYIDTNRVETKRVFQTGQRILEDSFVNIEAS